MKPDPDVSPLEAELQSERARSLGAGVAALEEALAELRDADAALAAARPPARAGLEARRADRFAEAAERLWAVVVQREAIGLHHHEILYEILEVPASVRRRMGPRVAARRA